MKRNGNDLEIVFSEEEIQARVTELGRRITEDYRDTTIACIGVLPNSMVFMADLIRHIDQSLTCDFLKVKTAGEDAQRVEIAFGTAGDYGGRDVLLVQGVVDTGVTLNFITGHIEETWKPRSLKVAALINRENHRKVGCPVTYSCFELEKEGFVAGYGLGYRELHRGARFLGFATREPRTRGGFGGPPPLAP
jgi:hypoxanthine phosphoribosyltransferase